MQRRTGDWRTVLLVVGAAAGALMAFGMAAVIVAYSLLGAAASGSGPAGSRSPLELVVLASALVVIGAVFLPAVYYGIRSLSGKEPPAARPRLLKVWQGALLILAWLGAAVGAGFLFERPILGWITPLLYLLAISIPVYFFARLATGGLRPGSRERTWGALAAGIGLGITPAIVLELLMAFLALVAIGVYVGLHPEQLAAFEDLARQLETSTDLEQVMNLAGPWLTSPVAFAAALFFFAGFSPVVEESAKSLAVWGVYDRLSRPAQGFAIGALSGAAFGLVESLLVSATPDTNWTTTLLVRGASTMMHIMAASLSGWGIGQFRATHSYARLLGMYLAAMGLHGLWNASVVAIAFGGLRSAAASSGPDAVGILLIFVGAAVLLMLFLAIPVSMGVINWRLRETDRAVAALAAVAAPAALPADTAPSTPASEVPWALGDGAADPPEDTQRQ